MYLYLSAEQLSETVRIAVIMGMELLKSILAQKPIRAAHQLLIAPLRQLMLAALTVHNLAKAKVRIGQGTKRLVRSRERFRRQSQQPLLIRQRTLAR